MFEKFGKCVHLVGAIAFGITFYVDTNIPLEEQGLSARGKYGGRWKFLTVWCLVSYAPSYLHIHLYH